MKSLSIILLLLFMLVGCGSTARGTGTITQVSPKLTWGEALALSDTPQKVAEWMMYNISYAKDVTPEDVNKPALKTVEDGTGDCEDYAILAKYMLDRHGYNTEVLFTFPEEGGTGHAVCVINHGENFSYISNANYINRRYLAYADIAGLFFYPGRWYIYKP